MGFDLLIGLIIIVATIVQAVASRRRGRPPKPSAPARPAPSQAPQPGGSFSRRLEEARRRVQEATGEGKGALVQTGQVPEARTLRPRAASLETDFGRPGRGAASLEGASLETQPFAEDRVRQAQTLEVAPPMRVQRTSPSKTARLSADELLQLDSKSVFRGVIWHQILSEPLSKQRSRRKISRRP